MSALHQHFAEAIAAINALSTALGSDPASRRQALQQIALHAQRRADELKAQEEKDA